MYVVKLLLAFFHLENLVLHKNERFSFFKTIMTINESRAMHGIDLIYVLTKQSTYIMPFDYFWYVKFDTVENCQEQSIWKLLHTGKVSRFDLFIFTL